MMNATASRPFEITDAEFTQVQRLIMEWAGISLGPNKRPLVVGRLSKRLRHYQLQTFTEYLNQPLRQNPGERQIMIDLLTTNETYFFREPAHFEFLQQHVLPKFAAQDSVRVWSAACSTGEEPYTLAMVLADQLGDKNWSILATDINTSVLEVAQSGLYDIGTADKIPRHYLDRYCLKGVRSKEGLMMMEPNLRQKIRFQQLNLQGDFTRLGTFDVIFLRNVMIYFNADTKKQLISRMAYRLNTGGYMFVGHSESLNGMTDQLVMKKPSVYQKTGT
jgi:chemotaxis protein methyltransferase CheR